MSSLFLVALALAVEPAPDLSDPYNRAVAEWAACARSRLIGEASASNERNMAVVERAMRDCHADEDAVRAFLTSRSNGEQAERTVAEIRAQMRSSLYRFLRRLRRR